MRHQSYSMYYSTGISYLGIIPWKFNSSHPFLQRQHLCRNNMWITKWSWSLTTAQPIWTYSTQIFCSRPFKISFIRTLTYSILTWRPYNRLVLLQRWYLQNFSSTRSLSSSDHTIYSFPRTDLKLTPETIISHSTTFVVTLASSVNTTLTWLVSSNSTSGD